MIRNYAQLEGDEKIEAEDKVDFLFTRSEVCSLIEYLTRHDQFGDSHIVSRAEDPYFQQVYMRFHNQGCGSFELETFDDWHNRFDVCALQLPSRDVILN